MPNFNDFAPRSYFFTDPAAITQTEDQAFGPVSENKFRLTSNFTITGSGSPAYAVCKSVVFIQPQKGNDTKVNLILRPYSQPVSGINIKYFVYRGLNKTDFFNGLEV